MHYIIVVMSLISSIVLAAIHTVRVGARGRLDFEPRSISASEGDIVIFSIQGNHDVAAGVFASPCQASTDGIYSGPYSDTDGGKKKFVVRLNNTDPIYYYCSIQDHCQEGMVGGINLPYVSTNVRPNFLDNAVSMQVLTATRSDGETIESYAEAAKAFTGRSLTPSVMRGGILEEDGQLANLMSSEAATASRSYVPCLIQIERIQTRLEWVQCD